jgi:hypothetical protein
MPPALKPWQVEYTEYPPYTEVTEDSSGRTLPPMPSKYFIKASLEYGIGSKITLQKIGRETPTIVTILEHVEVGYGVCPQVLHALLDSGEDNLVGKKVVVKLYDPLYVSPEYVFTERKLPVISPFGLTVLGPQQSTAEEVEPESSLAKHNPSRTDEGTLAGSTKKDLSRVDRAKFQLTRVQIPFWTGEQLDAMINYSRVVSYL